MESKKIEIYFFLIFFVIVIGLTLYLFSPYLDVIVLSATLAVIFKSLYKRLARTVRNNTISALIIVLITVLAVAGPFTFFGYQILGEIRDLYTAVNHGSSLDSVQQAFQSKIISIIPQDLRGTIDTSFIDIRFFLQQILNWLTSNLGTIFSNTLQIGLNFFLTLVALYYLLKDGSRFKDELVSLSPLSYGYTQKIFDKLQATATSVIKGTLVLAVFQGILAGIGYWIFGLPQATFWGSVTVIAALVPTLGTALVVVPAAAYLLVFGEPLSAIGLLAWGTLLVGTVDNVLRPYLVERDVKLHPFFILLSVFGGLTLFGPIGFLIGPLLISLLYALLEIYNSIYGEPKARQVRK
jgi:predicted PurR-regulated permease PerM